MNNRPPILIHLHIPKNAGTTLSRMIKLRLLTQPPTNLLHPTQTLGLYNVAGYENRLARIAALNERGRQRVRFFESHAGYGVHESLPREARYMTMLREPINRVLSVFSVRKQAGRIPADMSLEAFVHREDVGRVWWVDNAQVRFLAGEKGRLLDVPPGQCQPHHLELAKARLAEQIWFFGLVERFNESLCLLFRQLNWKPMAYLTGNVTPRRLSLAELPAAERQMIERVNALDIELYRFAREMFDRRVEAAGPGLAEQVSAYARRQGRVDRVLGPVARPLFNAWHKLVRLRR